MCGTLSTGSRCVAIDVEVPQKERTIVGQGSPSSLDTFQNRSRRGSLDTTHIQHPNPIHLSNFICKCG